MRKVIAFGSFDGLHKGHLFYLNWAKKHGDHLTLVVARDSSFKKWKHKQPYFSERERLDVVRELRFVDRAILGGTKNFLDVVYKVKPSVVALGYDHMIDENGLRQELKKHGLNCKVVRCRAFMPFKLKSSKLKEFVAKTMWGCRK